MIQLNRKKMKPLGVGQSFDDDGIRYGGIPVPIRILINSQSQTELNILGKTMDRIGILWIDIITGLPL